MPIWEFLEIYYSYQPGISGPTRRHHSSLEVRTMRIFNINRIKSSNSLVKREACTSRAKVGCSFSLWNLHQVHFRNCRTAGATRIKMETCWRRFWIAATSRFLCLQSLQLSNTGKFWTIIKQAVLSISPIFTDFTDFSIELLTLGLLIEYYIYLQNIHNSFKRSILLNKWCYPNFPAACMSFLMLVTFFFIGKCWIYW